MRDAHVQDEHGEHCCGKEHASFMNEIVNPGYVTLRWIESVSSYDVDNDVSGQDNCSFASNSDVMISCECDVDKQVCVPCNLAKKEKCVCIAEDESKCDCMIVENREHDEHTGRDFVSEVDVDSQRCERENEIGDVGGGVTGSATNAMNAMTDVVNERGEGGDGEDGVNDGGNADREGAGEVGGVRNVMHVDRSTCQRDEWQDEDLNERNDENGVSFPDESDGNENKSVLSFLHWNVQGLLSKLEDVDFVQFVSSFDIVCLVETFLEKFQSSVFTNFKPFVEPAVKLSRHGRCSGGIICLVRKSLLPYIKHNKCDSNNCLAFILNKDYFGFEKNVLLLCSYVPPEKSPFYTFYDYENGIDMLESGVIENVSCFDDVDILMCGDMNARTSDIVPSMIVDDEVISQHTKNDNHIDVTRCSQDKCTNLYGRKLIDMCTVLGLFILNGLCDGDPQGRYTYINDSGSSVNDYFLASSNLFYFLGNRINLRILDRIDSDHQPISLTIKHGTVNGKTSAFDENARIVKFHWKEACALHFISKMNSNDVEEKISEAEKLINVDVNKAMDIFNETVREQADGMRKRIGMNRTREQEWFDLECKLEKSKVRKLLRLFKKTSNDDDRSVYCIARREYKNLIKRKKKEYNELLVNKLIKSVKNQKEFWDTVRKVSKKKTQPSNDISVDEWHRHFQSLLDVKVEPSPDNAEEDDDGPRSLNRHISREEVLLAIRKMKNGKSAGPDGLIAEFFKNSGNSTVSFLVTLFNHLFDFGVYPANWTESIILPLFKKGDINNVNNYRGISLCDISSKLYSSIINNRLQEWITTNNSTGEHQAGFKRGYSTTDHVFTLMAAVQKQFVMNRKLYVAFVDFEKAFDSISRKLLWPILFKNGIKGKFYHCVKSMYDEVKARIRAGAVLSDYINCTRGVKQGDVCSPLLFSLFINELAFEIISKGLHGVTFELLELFILLFADDIVLLSTTVVGLQRQLNNLHTAATKLELKVNMDKTSIIVFRKGGYLSKYEKWSYGNENVSVANVYKYLGVYFSTKLSFSYTCDDLSCRAKKAVIGIFQVLYKLNISSFSIFTKLFDTQVQPILQYGAEIWALDKGTEIEKTHLLALKRFLNVNICTPNDLIYGELGRYPLYINSYVKCIKYWLQLNRMDDHRIPRKAYKTLYNLDSNGQKTWATNVRQFLDTYGFSFVWNNQGVENIVVFLRCLKQRIIDCRWQDWHDHVHSSDRFSMYSLFKVSPEIEQYVGMEINRYVKKALTRFRFGISDIACHCFRYSQRSDTEILCRLCHTANEDDLHFLLCCPALIDLRTKLIQPKFYRDPSIFRLSVLMSTRNEITLRNLATYIYLSLKRLRTAIS